MDHACYDIRDSHITRNEAMNLVKNYDGKCSEEYIKKRIKHGVTYCGWSTNRKNKNYINVCYKFEDENSIFQIKRV